MEGETWGGRERQSQRRTDAQDFHNREHRKPLNDAHMQRFPQMGLKRPVDNLWIVPRGDPTPRVFNSPLTQS